MVLVEQNARCYVCALLPLVSRIKFTDGSHMLLAPGGAQGCICECHGHWSYLHSNPIPTGRIYMQEERSLPWVPSVRRILLLQSHAEGAEERHRTRC